MKAFIILAIASVACAGHIGHLGHVGVAVANTGSSISTRSEDGLGNYKFGYNEQHATGGSSRSEAGNPWGVVGQYTLNVADGRQRIVKYVADGHGFRAAIKTNEQGTAPQPAAATSIVAPVAAQKTIAAAPVAVAAAPVAIGHGVGLGLGHGGLIGHGAGVVGLGHAGVVGLGHGIGLGHGGLVGGHGISLGSSVVSHAAPIAVGHVGLGYGKGW